MMRAGAMARRGVTIGVGIAALACASSGGNEEGSAEAPILDPCAAVDARLAGDVEVGLMEGDFRLTLVATEGPGAGTTADGRLTLFSFDDPALRIMPGPDGRPVERVELPLYGTVEIDLEPVGAVQVGELGATDPEAPGALLIRTTGEADETTGLTVRLGSDANRRGQTRFDGGYAALTIQLVTEDGFAGSWASGVERQAAGGYFCASRAGADVD